MTMHTKGWNSQFQFYGVLERKIQHIRCTPLVKTGRQRAELKKAKTILRKMEKKGPVLTLVYNLYIHDLG